MVSSSSRKRLRDDLDKNQVTSLIIHKSNRVKLMDLDSDKYGDCLKRIKIDDDETVYVTCVGCSKNKILKYCNRTYLTIDVNLFLSPY